MLINLSRRTSRTVVTEVRWHTSLTAAVVIMHDTLLLFRWISFILINNGVIKLAFHMLLNFRRDRHTCLIVCQVSSTGVINCLFVYIDFSVESILFDKNQHSCQKLPLWWCYKDEKKKGRRWLSSRVDIEVRGKAEEEEENKYKDLYFEMYHPTRMTRSNRNWF